mmetsp:Transcript_3459/g.9905  ORF Transcript_3459/g.9905 Transcript_3459/m.9905 type:complete len:214 (+) Transcript_3459:220-861(+)
MSRARLGCSVSSCTMFRPWRRSRRTTGMSSSPSRTPRTPTRPPTPMRPTDRAWRCPACPAPRCRSGLWSQGPCSWSSPSPASAPSSGAARSAHRRCRRCRACPCSRGPRPSRAATAAPRSPTPWARRCRTMRRRLAQTKPPHLRARGSEVRGPGRRRRLADSLLARTAAPKSQRSRRPRCAHVSAQVVWLRRLDRSLPFFWFGLGICRLAGLL